MGATVVVSGDREINYTDIRLLNKAIEEAKKSSHDRYWFGAVVAKNGIPIGIGMNIDTTHPLAPHPWHKQHAEFVALRKAQRSENNLNGYCIYIARVTKTRRMLGNAKPCPYCYEYIRGLGIDRIVFTRRDNSAGVMYE